MRRLSLLACAALAIAALACNSAPKETRTPAAPKEAAASRKAAPAAKPARQATVPELTLMDKPLRVESRANGITLEGRSGYGIARDQYFMLAVPPGAKSVVVERVVFENSFGERTDTDTSPTLLAEPAVAEEVASRFEWKDMGVMRRVGVGRLHAQTSRAMNSIGEQARITDFRVRIDFAEPAKGLSGAAQDSGFSEPDSPYREFVNSAVANPEAVDAYSHIPPPRTNVEGDRELVDWQPRPELSPGFPWLKIPVEKPGLYTIDAAWLREAGIDPATVKPEELQLVSLGRRVSLEPVTSGIASFADGQRLMFYAQENASRETVVRPYYLGRRGADTPEARFVQVEPIEGEADTVTSFRRHLRIEQDNELQTRVGSFLSIRGMTWIWQPIEARRPVVRGVTLPGLVEDGLPGALNIALYYGAPSVPGDIGVRVGIKNRLVHNGPLPQPRGFEETPIIRATIADDIFTSGTNNLFIDIPVSDAAMRRGVPPIFLDYLEFVYPSRILAEKGTLEIKGSEVEGTGPEPKNLRLSAEGFAPFRLNAVDITDPDAPARLYVDSLGRAQEVHARMTDSTRLLLLEDASIQRAPAPQRSVWTAFNPELAASDTLIVTHPDFAPVAEKLAEFLRGRGQMVHVENVDVLYERYTGGAPIHAALRQFAKETVLGANMRRPYQLVLVGDCSSDGRRLARNDVPNYVPTFSFYDPRRRDRDQFATDQVYAWLAGEDEIADILVGRISINNVDDGMRVVDKIIAYATQPQEQAWADSIATISDTGLFESRAQQVFEQGVGPHTRHRMLRIGDLPWEDNYFLPENVLREEDRKVAPRATAEIQRIFNEGTGAVIFFGHGAPNLWSNQRVWFGGDSENSDNTLLTNADRLSFVTSFTCNNAAIDYPMRRWNICIAEDMMRVPGGAVGVFMPSGPGYPDQHVHFAEAWAKAASRMGLRRLGVISELARLNYQARLGDDDHSRMYIYLGLPELELPRPRAHAKLQVTREDGTTAASYPDRGEPVRVAATFPDETTSATLTVRAADGTQMWSGGLALSGTEGVAEIPALATIGLPSPYEFHVAAVGKSGRGITGGVRIPLASSDVLISRLIDSEESRRSLARPLLVDLSNTGTRDAEGTLYLRLRDASGKQVVEDKTPFELAAGSTGTFARTVTAPAPGAYTLSVGTSISSLATFSPNSLPCPAYEVTMVFGETGEPLVLLQDRVGYFPPLTGGRRNGRIRVPVANTGDADIEDLRFNVTTFGPDGAILDPPAQVRGGRLAAGTARLLFAETRMPRDVTGDLRLEVEAWDYENPASPRRLLEKSSATILKKDLPDLRVITTSFRIEPANLTEGVTVFVRGRIQNYGGGMVSNSTIGLYSDSPAGPQDPLPNMAGPSELQIPALERGATWDFTLRWDPADEVGATSMWMVIDGRDQLAESEKEFNIAKLNLTFRSKWELRAGQIGLRRGADRDSVVLVAPVANDGETDAQRVAVRFFRSTEQTPQNFLGEVLVPRLPAESVQNVEYVWRLSPEDRAAKVRPSFTVSLKGSLQRISSATE